MSNLRTGRIYKIIHNQSNIIYVGSTFNTLRDRIYAHKNSYKQWLKDNTSEVSIFPYFKEYGFFQFTIILIQEYLVVDRDHLKSKEQLWINKLRKNVINRNNPFYIKKFAQKEQNKQFYAKNKLELAKKNKQYRIDNKETLNARENEKFNCECGGKYSKVNHSKHKKTNKHQVWINSQ
jgi:hypothetical protein